MKSDDKKMKPSSQNKGVDLVAGSEKILRVHHRNMVHARYLQHSLDNLDAICKRNLNRVQQEIYTVYYSEYVPLMEWRKRIKDNDQGSAVKRGTKKFGLAGDGRVRQKCVLPEISSSTHSIYSSPTPSSISRISDVHPLPPIFNKPKSCGKTAEKKQVDTSGLPLSVILKIPEIERSRFIGKWKEEFDRHCPSVISRAANGSPDVDKDRLKVIRDAIALSSQPAPDSDFSRKNRRLRKSFLASLRKPSLLPRSENFKVNKETRRKASITREHSAKSRDPTAQQSDHKIEHITVDTNTVIKSLAECSNSSMREFAENVKGASVPIKAPMYQSFPNSPVDESYYSGSPEFFSEIDEEPSSYEDTDYDGSSYTYDSGSSYWEYTDEESSDYER